MRPDHVNPMQWDQAMAIARQACSRVFRDGGRPADAYASFGLPSDSAPESDWGKAVEAIAHALYGVGQRHAA